MPSDTLKPKESKDLTGSIEVKVTDSAPTAGSVSVRAPNVPPVDYPIPPNGSKHIQIPLGTSTFLNTGTVDLELSW